MCNTDTNLLNITHLTSPLINSPSWVEVGVRGEGTLKHAGPGLGTSVVKQNI